MRVDVTVFLQSTTVPKTSNVKAFGGVVNISFLEEDIANNKIYMGWSVQFNLLYTPKVFLVYIWTFKPCVMFGQMVLEYGGTMPPTGKHGCADGDSALHSFPDNFGQGGSS